MQSFAVEGNFASCESIKEACELTIAGMNWPKQKKGHFKRAQRKVREEKKWHISDLLLISVDILHIMLLEKCSLYSMGS